MFNISRQLNKQAKAIVLFVNKDYGFDDCHKYFSKIDINQLSLFKSDISSNDILEVDLINKNIKKKVIIVKIKKVSLSEYDYQKIGGLVYNSVKSFDSVNILSDSEFQIRKNSYLFALNFWLGFFSKSYVFRNYKLNDYKNKISLKKISYLNLSKKIIDNAIKEAKNIYQGIEEARNLVTFPANILNPKNFVNKILKLKKIGLSVEIFDEKKMKLLGMNALLGVGQGSSNESYMAVIKWNGDKKLKKSPLVFVGKGVCFDTGGISLKPASHMEDMKYDMAGAATVTGLMKTLALRRSKVNVVGLVGLVENMADGNAQRPGDVVKSYSGQSIEILNTDAEGRLVLADVISYAEERFKPSMIINLATLTGAIIVSLGNEYAGLFSNNDRLANLVHEVGLKDNEKAWRLPLHENYDRLMDSKIADLQNINYSGGAGSITAAQFLQRFIKYNTPWAHLDIAGMAWAKKDTEVVPEGATGYGVKLLNRLVKEYYEK